MRVKLWTIARKVRIDPTCRPPECTRLTPKRVHLVYQQEKSSSIKALPSWMTLHGLTKVKAPWLIRAASLIVITPFLCTYVALMTVDTDQEKFLHQGWRGGAGSSLDAWLTTAAAQVRYSQRQAHPPKHRW